MATETTEAPERGGTGMQRVVRNTAFMLAGEAGVKRDRRFFDRRRNRALRLALVVLAVDLGEKGLLMNLASEVFRRSTVCG